MAKEYALSDAQKAQVYDVNLAMAEMKKLREEYNAKIEKIFTKEQYEAYTKKQAEGQKRMTERGERRQRTNR